MIDPQTINRLVLPSVSLEMRSRSSVAIACNEEYMNITLMAASCGKRVADFLALKSTKRFVKDLAQELGLSPSQLVQVNKGGIPSLQGTWAHKKIAERVRQWLERPGQVKTEDIFQKRLHSELKGKREVIHPTGAIDLLTQSQIIEIKEVSNWMKGVGQLMIYGQDYPFHLKRLHLFGDVGVGKRELIERYCRQLSIKVTWEKGSAND